jgi:protein involved in polysaccharide export with SLBB domain
VIKNSFYIIIILLATAFCQNIYAQRDITNTNSQNTSSNNSNNTNFKINADAPDIINQFSNSSNIQYKSFPIDKAINPDNYIVGPNDMFNLSIYGYINQTLPLIVNLEGSLIVPTIGEIKVNGLTLSETKDKVIRAVKKRYYSSEVSLSISTPRTFLISISSIVQKKIEVSPISRPSDIINLIFYDTANVSKLTYKYNNPKEFFNPEISLRNIELIRKNGSIVDVDLYKYFNTNDDKYNPYFLDGDLLKIPYGQLAKNYITVEGAVQLAGVYEYNKNDDLESIIGLSRGFDTDAEPDSISVFRIYSSTNKYDVINLSYNDNRDFKINVYDRVLVKYKSNYVKNLSVTILGEVNRPGIYPITFKNTTLKEAIEIAGGFKSTAYLPLSIVFRKYDKEYNKNDTNEILINMRTNDLIVNEKDKLSFERDIISKRNRMVIDFEKLFKDGDLSQNIMLEDKDVIYINDDKKVVYVYGQVLNEGFVTLKEGADYEYYIDKAGGFSLAADEGNTRIIKFNSRGWYKPNKVEVLSGDFIYVPKKSPTEFKDTFTIIATMIGVVASLITTYLLIKQNQ